MGYDISFHAIDMRLVDERILPFLAGDGADDDLDDLVGRAVDLAKVRYRANAWALGTLRVAGRDGPFIPHLHLWGRPFFITSHTPEDVAAAVLRYTDATPDMVDAIARDMLTELDPALVRQVEPDTTGTLPGDEQLANDIFWRVRLLRDAGRAVAAGSDDVTDPGTGRTFQAADILATSVPFAVVCFAQALLPGWMDRGRVWPTELADQADLGWPAGYGGNAPLVGRLRDDFPTVTWEFSDTIVANYTVGGFVAPAEIAAARAWLIAHDEPLSAAGDAESVRLALRKVDEALVLAARVGGGFAEATEVYSGMAGRLN